MVKNGTKHIVRTVYRESLFGTLYFKYEGRWHRIEYKENGTPHAFFFNSVKFI